MNTLPNSLRLIWWQRRQPQPRAASIPEAKAKQKQARDRARSCFDRLSTNGSMPMVPTLRRGNHQGMGERAMGWLRQRLASLRAAYRNRAHAQRQLLAVIIRGGNPNPPTAQTVYTHGQFAIDASQLADNKGQGYGLECGWMDDSVGAGHAFNSPPPQPSPVGGGSSEGVRHGD